MHRFVPALAFLVLVAGCVTPGTLTEAGRLATDGGDLPALACFEDARSSGEGADGPAGSSSVCNFEATTTNTEGNEVTIAVNPTDPLNIVAGAKDYSPWTAGECVWDGIYVTKDGGKTWINHHVPGSPHLLAAGNTSGWEPTYASQFWCTTDPVVAFGPDGTCYYSLMAYQADPVTSSKLGEGVFPQGALNDWAFNRAAQLVAVSSDGCVTFDRVSPIFDGTYPVNFHDKQWIEVGADGTVHVAWLSFFVPGNQYFRSTDKGQSWEGPIVLATWGETLSGEDLPGAPAGQGTIITVGNGGRDVYVSWNAGAGIYVATSHDGGASFEEAKLAVETQDDGMEADYRSGGMPFIVADDSDVSPHYGNVYLAWQDTRDGDRDIFVSASTDGGATWGEPVKVSDAPQGSDQFFPAMSVGPDGILDVVFYDRRADPDAKLLHLMYTYSTDGGLTWTPNARVTEVAVDPTMSHHQNGMVFIGDYIDIDSSAGAAHPVWVDTRNGVADVFTATILRGPLAQAALPPGAQAGAAPEVDA